MSKPFQRESRVLDNVHFFGLLHVPKFAAANQANADPARLLTIYVGNALALSLSLARLGYAFTLVTDDHVRVQEAAAEIAPNISLDVMQLTMARAVPQDIAFHSAHHKLDLLQLLAEQSSAVVGILDLDIIALRKISPQALSCIAKGGFLAYEISDQVFPAYGQGTVVENIRRIAQGKGGSRWFGGEFLLGQPSGFADLARATERVWPRYMAECRSLHHQGDEMVTTAALNDLIEEGFSLTNSSEFAAVKRFWSGRVHHRQPSFSDIEKKYSLLHLPQDKAFLLRLAQTSSTEPVSKWVDRYKQYLLIRQARNVVAGIAAKLRARPRDKT